MTDERRIGETITTVSRQLASWGAPEPLAKATDLVNALLRDGWRPRAAPVSQPTTTERVTYEPTEDYRSARKAIRGTCETEPERTEP